jgi:hypothetical protein
VRSSNFPRKMRAGVTSGSGHQSPPPKFRLRTNLMSTPRLNCNSTVTSRLINRRSEEAPTLLVPRSTGNRRSLLP